MKWLNLLGVLLAVSAGCWQEVHYEPKKPETTISVHDEAGPTAGRQGDSEEPANEAVSSEVTGVTAGELFGTPDETALPEVAEAQLDSGGESVDNSAEVNELPGPQVADSNSGLDDSELHDKESAEPSVETVVEDPSPENEPSHVAPPLPVETLRPSRTALAVWQMSSRWSLAAAIYAKNQPEASYRELLDKAAYAADLVGLELPTLPTSAGMNLETAVIGYLLDTGTATFVTKLGENYVPEYEELARLAVRTNALLLVYTPKSEQLDPLIASIRQAAEGSGLPLSLWSELVTMLEERAPFAEVKQRVMAFHTEVSDYLAGEN